MNSGTGLNLLQKAMPERYFDVGIAEQQALLFAAGLALQGARPVAAIYSTFLQRAYDQIVHDVCLQRAARRAGDGPRRARRRRRPDAPRRVRHRLPALPAEHHADGAARRGDARAHAAHRAPARRRPGRAPLSRAARRSACALPSAPGAARDRHGRDPARGRARRDRRLRHGRPARRSARPTCSPRAGSTSRVADARFAKPLDTGLLAQLAAEHDLLVTVEEGVLAGGFGTAVWEALSDGGLAPRILRVGLPDRYVTHGAPKLLHAEVGYTPERIAERDPGRRAGSARQRSSEPARHRGQLVAGHRYLVARVARAAGLPLGRARPVSVALARGRGRAGGRRAPRPGPAAGREAGAAGRRGRRARRRRAAAVRLARGDQARQRARRARAWTWSGRQALDVGASTGRLHRLPAAARRRGTSWRSTSRTASSR